MATNKSTTLSITKHSDNNKTNKHAVQWQRNFPVHIFDTPPTRYSINHDSNLNQQRYIVVKTCPQFSTVGSIFEIVPNSTDTQLLSCNVLYLICNDVNN